MDTNFTNYMKFYPVSCTHRSDSEHDGYYTFMALVVGRYEALITIEKYDFISPYNKGHKLFIIPKLHTQQQSIF